MRMNEYCLNHFQSGREVLIIILQERGTRGQTGHPPPHSKKGGKHFRFARQFWKFVHPLSCPLVKFAPPTLQTISYVCPSPISSFPVHLQGLQPTFRSGYMPLY